MESYRWEIKSTPFKKGGKPIRPMTTGDGYRIIVHTHDVISVRHILQGRQSLQEFEEATRNRFLAYLNSAIFMAYNIDERHHTMPGSFCD
jgi:hypothetical protein